MSRNEPPGCKRSGIIIAHQNERHRIQRVIRMRPARHGIDHRLRIAVIGSDDPRAALRLESVVNSAEPGVDRFDRFDRRFEFAGMADHVGIRVIHDDRVERSTLSIAFTTVSVIPSADISGLRS